MLRDWVRQLHNTRDFHRRYTDKTGCSILLRPALQSDFSRILAMYDDFEPKESAQGLPSADPERRRKWVQQILDESLNVIALAEERVTGHACLIEIPPGTTSELEIAVHQDFQDRGIGFALLQSLVGIARSCHCCRIWLTVDAMNHRAIRMYQKCGFCFKGPFDIERDMELTLDNAE